MAVKEIIIKVSNNYIYLNPEFAIAISQTNLPVGNMTFRSHKDIYWGAEMLKYDKLTNCLSIRISDFNKRDADVFRAQKPKRVVRRLRFDKLDWQRLEPQLTSYKKKGLQEIIYNADKEPITAEETTSLYSVKKSEVKNDVDVKLDSQLFSPTGTGEIKVNETIPFSELNFRLGYASFEIYIPEMFANLEFKINNDHLLAEFDTIKMWFAKKLGLDKIEVSIKVKLRGDEVVEKSAWSRDIQRITPELIEGVKYQRTLALPSMPGMDDRDKSLFSADELFDQIESKDAEGNTFHQSEEDVLNLLIDQNEVRNKKHLAYLAQQKQSSNYKLRYTSSPNFGFLFLIEGEVNNHFVWELLNSNATYIWSIAKDEDEINRQFKRVEKTIALIREHGRRHYKQAYRNNHLDDNLIFRAIDHSSINSNFLDDFPKWKNRLNEQLT